MTHEIKLNPPLFAPILSGEVRAAITRLDEIREGDHREVFIVERDGAGNDVAWYNTRSIAAWQWEEQDHE